MNTIGFHVRWFGAAFLPLIIFDANATVVAAPPEVPWEEIVRILGSKSLGTRWHDDRGRSIIYFELRYGSETKAISYIQKAKSDRVHISDADAIFDLAIDQGFQQVVTAMLASGYRACARTGFTPLMRASAQDRLQIIRQLISAGCRTSDSFDGKTPYTYALANGHYFALRLLAAAADNFENFLKKPGNSAVFFAIDGGSPEAIFFLARSKADFNQRNDDGETSLTYAIARQANEGIVRQLIDAGANPCMRNSTGKRPLDLLESHPEPLLKESIRPLLTHRSCD